MRRYQLYLNQDSVSILDEFEQLTKISRSKLIRDTVDQLSANLRLVLVNQGVPTRPNSALTRLIGVIPKVGSAVTDYARRHDREYLKD